VNNNRRDRLTIIKPFFGAKSGLFTILNVSRSTSLLFTIQQVVQMSMQPEFVQGV